MNKTFIVFAIAGSMAVSLSAFANQNKNSPSTKAPAYQAPVYQAPVSNDNLDWSKGWYVGAGVNANTQYTMDLNGMPEVFMHVAQRANINNLTINEVTVEQDSTNVGFDVYLGRQISKHWAAELGYTYVGTVNFDGTTTNTSPNNPLPRNEKGQIGSGGLGSVQVKQWNVHMVGVGILPVGEYVNFFLKGGIAYFNSTQEFSFTTTNISVFSSSEKMLPPTPSTPTEVTDTTHTMALTYGAGAELAVNQWGLRLEYNSILPPSHVREDFYIADLISANVFYRFD